MKRWMIAAAVAAVVTAGCATGITVPAGGGSLPELPAKDLSGWVRVGTPNAEPNAVVNPVPPVATSPNARYVAFVTDEVLGADPDPDPSAENVYLLDLDTTTYRLATGAWAEARPLDIRDDGTLLLTFRNAPTDPLQYAVF